MFIVSATFYNIKNMLECKCDKKKTFIYKKAYSNVATNYM